MTNSTFHFPQALGRALRPKPRTFDELRAELLAASDPDARERILREIQSLTYQVASTP